MNYWTIPILLNVSPYSWTITLFLTVESFRSIFSAQSSLPKGIGKSPLNHTLERFQSPKSFIHKAFDKKKNPNFVSKLEFFYGAIDGTWTRTRLRTRPSNVCVCQFRHDRMLLSATLIIIPAYTGFVNHKFMFFSFFFAMIFSVSLFLAMGS